MLKRYLPVEDESKIYFFDDFSGTSYNTNTWTTQSGSGSILLPESPIGGQLIVRANANNYYAMIAGLSLFVNTKLSVTWRTRINSLTSSRAAFGAAQSTTSIIEWIYEAALGGNWRLRAYASATETVVDTGIAADTNWHEFTIVGNSGVINFFLDNAPVGVITTNLPTSSLGPFVKSTSTTAATKDIYIDWVEIYANRV